MIPHGWFQGKCEIILNGPPLILIIVESKRAGGIDTLSQQHKGRRRRDNGRER
jgi:hypothetical protein